LKKVGMSWRKWGSAGFLCTVLIFWLGCSEEKHYQTLSFFFDGVPDPHARAATRALTAEELATMSPADRSGLTARSIHKPYAEQNCTACHPQDIQAFAPAVDSVVCMNCHKPVLTEHTVMHGAVVGKACLWCHEPHESLNPSLIKTTAQSMCIQCHDRELLSQRIIAHQLTVGNCLDCHFGHGGEKAPFLKPAAATMPLRK